MLLNTFSITVGYMYVFSGKVSFQLLCPFLGYIAFFFFFLLFVYINKFANIFSDLLGYHFVDGSLCCAETV